MYIKLMPAVTVPYTNMTLNGVIKWLHLLVLSSYLNYILGCSDLDVKIHINWLYSSYLQEGISLKNQNSYECLN